MVTFARLVLALVLSISLVNQSLANNANLDDPTTTILISIDGLSQIQFKEFKPKTLTRLANKGLVAEALLPVFPSKTFPNHLSIVTGVYPSEHGIIHNRFYRRDKQVEYTLGAGKVDPSWVKAKPIWILAEEQNITAASYFWPESEAKLFGKMPTFFYPYSDHTSNKARIDQVIKWMDMPSAERPKLITTYFSVVDSTNHDFGTRSPQVKKALKEVDTLIGDLVDTIEKQNKNFNLIVVSDHGMIDINKKINQGSLKSLRQADKVVNGQTQLFVYHDDKVQLEAMKKSLEQQSAGRFDVFLSDEFPQHWHMIPDNNVVPDLIINSIPPYYFIKSFYKTAATHGYDVEKVPEMEAVFLAYGKDIKQGKIDKFRNIHVFALLAKLIGVEVNDKRPANLNMFKDYIH